MDKETFDTLTRGASRACTRRTAAIGLAAGLLGLSGLRAAAAEDVAAENGCRVRRCSKGIPGDRCNNKRDCCKGLECSQRGKCQFKGNSGDVGDYCDNSNDCNKGNCCKKNQCVPDSCKC